MLSPHSQDVLTDLSAESENLELGIELQDCVAHKVGISERWSNVAGAREDGLSVRRAQSGCSSGMRASSLVVSTGRTAHFPQVLCACGQAKFCFSFPVLWGWLRYSPSWEEGMCVCGVWVCV